MDNAEYHTGCSSLIGLLLILCTKTEGDPCIHTDTKAHRNGCHQVLDGIYQRKGCHGIFTDSGNEVTVHDVVQGIDRHGEYHGQRHGDHKRQYFLFFHKILIHFLSLL